VLDIPLGRLRPRLRVSGACRGLRWLGATLHGSRPVPPTVHLLVTVMSDGTFPVQWSGQQAVVKLPEHIDASNADPIREQLLWIINRGPRVLVADLAGTVSCDYSGADALARAYSRAVANGTQMRLVVTATVVRRVFSLNGLDRLIPVYPDLAGAIAASAERRKLHQEQGTGIKDRAALAEELLDSMADTIFNIGLILQAALDLPPDATTQHITEALRCLDDAVREIRNHAFARHGQGTGPEQGGIPSPDLPHRWARARNRSKLLQVRVAQTARAVQSAAANTAVLLQRRADLLGQPGRIDYPIEIKRWRILADQAEQMAERWEQLRP
jgi:anti-sigma B factor antagonist